MVPVVLVGFVNLCRHSLLTEADLCIIEARKVLIPENVKFEAFRYLVFGPRLIAFM